MVLEDLVFTRIASKCYVLPSYCTWLMYAVNILSFTIFHSLICKLFWPILALLGITSAFLSRTASCWGFTWLFSQSWPPGLAVRVNCIDYSPIRIMLRNAPVILLWIVVTMLRYLVRWTQWFRHATHFIPLSTMLCFIIWLIREVMTRNNGIVPRPGRETSIRKLLNHGVDIKLNDHSDVQRGNECYTHIYHTWTETTVCRCTLKTSIYAPNACSA
jgi:hypothetical protein